MKKVKYNIIIIPFLIILSTISFGQSFYKGIFKEDYIDAINWFKDNYRTFHELIDETNINEAELISVVFPERIRYSVIRNYFETEALKLLYTKYGSESVDFSIGDLQLKPSFAEKIEHYVYEEKNLKKYSKLIILESDSVKKREERVRRLEILPWQIFYICAFYEITENMYDLNEMRIDDKIKFIASAYNHGFDSGKNEIEEHIGIRFFPYGKHYPGNQYAYTDVALDFYLYFFTEIKIKKHL